MVQPQLKHNEECDWLQQKALINYKLDQIERLALEVKSAKRLVWPLVISIVVMFLVAVPSTIAVIQLFKHP